MVPFVSFLYTEKFNPVLHQLFWVPKNGGETFSVISRLNLILLHNLLTTWRNVVNSNKLEFHRKNPGFKLNVPKILCYSRFKANSDIIPYLNLYLFTIFGFELEPFISEELCLVVIISLLWWHCCLHLFFISYSYHWSRPVKLFLVRETFISELLIVLPSYFILRKMSDAAPNVDIKSYVIFNWNSLY